MSKWHIDYDPKPIPDRNHDWNYWHDDDESLCGTAKSKEHAKKFIAEIEDATEHAIDENRRQAAFQGGNDPLIEDDPYNN